MCAGKVYDFSAEKWYALFLYTFARKISGGI